MNKTSFREQGSPYLGKQRIFISERKRERESEKNDFRMTEKLMTLVCTL